MSLWPEVLLVVGSVLAVLLPVSPLVREYASRDSGVFLYTGWRLLNGEVPYLDVWDHKPPMVFFIDALGLGIGNGSVWGVWWLEVAFLLVAVVISLALLRRLVSRNVALLGTFLWLVNLIYLLAGGNLTGEYALPLQFGLFYLFWQAEKRGEYGWRAVVIGVLSALIFFTRQNSIGIPIAIGIYLLVARWRAGELGRLWRELRGMVVGALIVILPIVIYFVVNGALAEFWDAAFVFNFVYVGERSVMDRLTALWAGVQALAPAGLIFLAGAGWVATAWRFIRKLSIPKGLRPILILLVVNLPIEVLLVSLGGRPRIPYFTTLLPILAVLAGYSIWLGYIELKKRNIRQGAFTGMVVLLVAAFNWNAYIAGIEANRNDGGLGEVVAYVEQNSQPDDYVLMIGAETAVNFHAQRVSPTRYVYQYPLYRGGYTDDVELASFFEYILEKQPQLIIVALDGGEIPNRFGPNKTAESEALTHEINGVYTPVTEFENGWVAYEYVGE
ncbi:MAG: hypothetical protein HND51_19320 [Chloroflexi bacterium]|nr:hypothetical protein [Chloroflexota bacterium]